MRFTCAGCRSDIVLTADQVGLQGYSGTCSICQTSFTLEPDRKSGDVRIVFSGDGKAKRICINCSSEFIGPADEAIPICLKCQNAETEEQVAPPQRAPLPPSRGWTLDRVGKQVNLDSEAAVREWIRQGLIDEEDTLIAPDNRRLVAGKVARFREIFRSVRYKSKPVERVSLRRRARRILSARLWIESLSVVFFSTVIGWAAYRIATYHPVTESDDPALTQLAEKLAPRISLSRHDPATLISRVRELFRRDLPESHDEARRLAEQAFVVDPKIPEALGLLALAYGYASAYGDQAGQRLTAIELADLAARLYPDMVEGRLAKTRAALGAENLMLAQSSSREAMSMAPHDPRVLLSRAAVLAASAKGPGELASAVDSATAALQRDPLALEGYDILGVAAYRRGEPDRALEFFEERLRKSENDSVALYRIGSLHDRAGDSSAALEWYQRALRSSASLIPARLAMATLYERDHGDFAAAERHLRDVLGRYRRFARTAEVFQTQRSLSRILLDTERSGDASDLMGKFPMMLSSEPVVLLTRAEILIRTLRKGDAVPILEEGIRNHPDHPRLRLALARAMENLRRPEDAIRAYRDVISAEPLWKLPYFHLAKYLVSIGRYDEASDVANAAVTRAGLYARDDMWRPERDSAFDTPWAEFHPAFRQFSQKKPAVAVARALSGLAYLEENRSHGAKKSLSNAIRELDIAAQIDSNMEAIPVYLGISNARLERWGEAERYFRQALSLNPVSPITRLFLASTLIRKKAFPEAETILRNLAENAEIGYRARYELGTIEMGRGKTSEAARLWRESMEKEPDYVPPWRALLGISKP